MRIALVGPEFEENLAVRYIWGALEAAGHEVAQVVFSDEGQVERAALHAEALLRDVSAFGSIAVGEGETAMVDLAAHLDAPSDVRIANFHHDNFPHHGATASGAAWRVTHGQEKGLNTIGGAR